LLQTKLTHEEINEIIAELEKECGRVVPLQYLETLAKKIADFYSAKNTQSRNGSTAFEENAQKQKREQTQKI
jgi:hypothetical protein